MKSQRCLAQFLCFLGDCQVQLEKHQKHFSTVCRNPNALYRLINNSSKSLSPIDLIKFVKSFGFNLWEPEISGTNYKVAKKISNKDELLQKAVQLLVKEYGHDGQLSFADFCWLALGDFDTMVYNRDGKEGYQTKDKLFLLVQTQLQNLLSIQAFKRMVVEDTPNLSECFNQITKGQLTPQHILRLLETNGIFIQYSPDKIISRLKGNLKYEDFTRYFSIRATPKESKIFYSSTRRGSLHQSNVSFGTPIKKTTALTQTSTNKRAPSVLSQVKVKEFQEQTKSQFSVLEQIVAEQATFEKYKQKRLLCSDIDFQLIYDRLHSEFEDILKYLYKDSSFTSFLRFLFPTPTFWQYQYLGFIRYNIDNKLSEESLQNVRQIREEYVRKEKRIENLWKQYETEGLNKVQLFKNMSSDSQSVKIADVTMCLMQLKRIFPEKSVRLLKHRMDRLDSGKILIETFL